MSKLSQALGTAIAFIVLGIYAGGKWLADRLRGRTGGAGT